MINNDHKDTATSVQDSTTNYPRTITTSEFSVTAQSHKEMDDNHVIVYEILCPPTGEDSKRFVCEIRIPVNVYDGDHASAATLLMERVRTDLVEEGLLPR